MEVKPQMQDSSIQQVSPNSTALNAEHYQTFEMAKANDDVLGGDSIAQIRSYAAYARAQAQAIHKTIAATTGIDDVASIKAEATETAQTFAKVGVYADQRIGEILRELPTKQGKRTDVTSSPVGNEVTKREALNEAGFTPKTAAQLEQLAANPEVVQAVIDKATEEGRIVSRSQVLKAIDEKKRAEQERDEARQDLQEAYLANENIELEVESLKEQLKRRPEPEVIEREVIPEETRKTIRELEKSNKQFSEDYEDLRRRFSSTQTELEQARKELATNESTLASIREIQALTRAMGEFVGRYNGHTWPFADVDEQTMSEFMQELQDLNSFLNKLEKYATAQLTKLA